MFRLFVLPDACLRQVVSEMGFVLLKPGKKRPDYSEQGQLFEQITALALERLLPGWKVLRTGWSPDHPKEN